MVRGRRALAVAALGIAAVLSAGHGPIVGPSITTRGFPDGVCTVTSTYGIDVSPERRARDAYAALAHLRAQPYVDGSRVGLMGGARTAGRPRWPR
jgi:dienelactone hydrolase